MRQAFAETVEELANSDSRVVLLTGDLGYSVLERFAKAHPKRFFNVGVAEQNMLGIATGLAKEGYIPFAYSIAPFASLRPFEFIRNGPVLHQLPVRIIGVGGGFEYGHAGPTHYALEDIGVLRTLPGLSIIVPADSNQTRSAIRATHNLPGPIYFRLGKDDRKIVPGLAGEFALAEPQVLKAGSKVNFVVIGPLAVEALSAAQRLEEKGISAGVIVVSTLAVNTPAANTTKIANLNDTNLNEQLATILRSAPCVITVEAHYLHGGLGSLVAETIAEFQLPCRLIRQAVRNRPDGVSGSQAFLEQREGLDVNSLVAAAASF